MASLRLCLVIAGIAVAAPVQAQGVAEWRPHVEEASARFGVPADWIEQVMRAESGGHTTLNGRPIVSRAGAMGLMQLMPGTWADMRARLGLGFDPHAPRDNILAGTYYLRLMYDRFGYPGLFAAYNAGPGRYAAFVTKGRPLPLETRAYVAGITGSAVPVAEPSNRGRATSRQQFAIFFSMTLQGTGRDDRGSDTSPLFVRLTAAVDHP